MARCTPPPRGPPRRRLRSAAVAAAVAAAAATTAAVITAPTPGSAQACLSPVSTCDGSVDLFPSKIDPIRHSTTLSNLAYTPTYVDIDVAATEEAAADPLRYRFVRCGCAGAVPPGSGRTVISVPPTRLYVGDSSSLSQLAREVGVIDRVTVIGNVFTIYSPVVRGRVRAGLTRSLITDPTEFTVNYTKLLDPAITGGEAGSSPPADAPLLAVVPARDLEVFANATGGAIPVVSVGELEEVTPLGRAEYVQFMALLTDRAVQSNEAYATIVRSYEASAAAAAAAVRRPSVLVGWPFGGMWTQPAELTYAAALLADANLDHRYLDDNRTEAVSLTLDEVARDFRSADLWVNAGLFPGSPSTTVDDLLAADANLTAAVLGELEAVRCGEVWINQLRVSTDGTANDYFEEGAVRPDKVLADLVRLGHPTVTIPGEFNYVYRATPSAAVSCPHAQLPVEPPAGALYVDTDVRVVGGGLSRWDVEDDLVGEVYPAVATAAGIPAADLDVFFDTPPSEADPGVVALTVRARREVGGEEGVNATAIGEGVVRGMAAALPAATAVTASSVTVVGDDGGSRPEEGGGGGTGDDGGLSGGAVAGIVFACLGALALVVAAAGIAFLRGRKKGEADRDAYWQQQERLTTGGAEEAGTV